MITAQGVSKFLGNRELFGGVSFHVHHGERVGLVGPNGAGKTTLFHILLGEMEPDSGSIARSKSLRKGYLPQQWTPAEDRSVLCHAQDVNQQLALVRAELSEIQKSIDTATGSDQAEELALRQAQLIEQLEHLGGYDLESRSLKILSGLGFRPDMLGRPVSSLSGGWVMRLELARLLLTEPDLLLLDEPTNHLDLESLIWLEEYLLTTSSAVILVSHDRAFLNRVVNRIIELENGHFQEYSGNYDRYLEEKGRRTEIQLASYRNQQDRIKQVERFIERNRYRKSTARRAQSRIKLLEKIEIVDTPTEQATIRFQFPEPPRSGKRVMELVDVRKSYGDHAVYTGINLVVERGDRIAFLGPNGAGKSTLLKILAGIEAPSGGERIVGQSTAIGYYAQYQWEQLNPQWTALQEASSMAGDMPQSQLRSLLGAFLFRGDDVLKLVSVLSGGEKARLILCKLLLQRPNLLLLDEPTNHLDIPSRDILVEALSGFSGTICFISHDRHFINAIASKTLLAASGKIHLFPGNYSDYQNIWKPKIEQPHEAHSNTGTSAEQKKTVDGTARRGQEQKRQKANWRNELYRLRMPLQKKVTELEALLSEAHSQLDDLNRRLSDPSTYQDGRSIQDLQKEYQLCRHHIKALTEEWEEKAIALEDLEQNFWKDKPLQPGAGLEADSGRFSERSCLKD